MKKCGCGIFVACDYHTGVYAKIDRNQTSLQIARAMAKRANRSVGEHIERAENWAAGLQFALTVIVLIICAAVMFFAVTERGGLQ
jgi:hypothetical protein